MSATVIRESVRTFVAAGPLPDEDATAEEIDRRSDQLDAIMRPVSDEEAALLLTTFGKDECYGVAWTLLALIETAPNVAVADQPGDDANEWIRMLWRRVQNGKMREARKAVDDQ